MTGGDQLARPRAAGAQLRPQHAARRPLRARDDERPAAERRPAELSGSVNAGHGDQPARGPSRRQRRSDDPIPARPVPADREPVTADRQPVGPLRGHRAAHAHRRPVEDLDPALMDDRHVGAPEGRIGPRELDARSRLDEDRATGPRLVGEQPTRRRGVGAVGGDGPGRRDRRGRCARRSGRREQCPGDGDERQGVAGPGAAEQAGAQRHRIAGPLPGGAVGDRGEGGDRQGAAEAEADPDHQPGGRIAERQADPDQRPDAVGEHEGGEAEAEQDAVTGGRQGHRQGAAPADRELAPDLRDDRHPASLGDRGGERQGRRDAVGDASGGPDQRRAQHRDRRERDHSAEHREGNEGGGGGERRRHPPGVTGRADRLDHREAARRPRARRPDQQGRGRQRDQQRVHQQGTLVS